jgi:LysR family glycine cleavage system transcriptional activator
MSLARAAEELNVTPAAVSHQIKALEEWLGLRLFVRHNGALRLTPAGQTYVMGIAEGLDKLWESTEQVAIPDSRNTLSLVVPPSIAAEWLVPRLHRYRARKPEAQLRITVLTPPIDFSEHMMDLGIGFGWEVAPDRQRIPWLSYEIIAVCSPALLARHPVETPSDLRHHELIHDEALKIHDRLDWRAWLELMGADDVDTGRGPRFSHATHAIQTARLGHGVVLAKSALVAGDLQSGDLVRVFDHGVPSELTYDLIVAEAVANTPKIAHFRDWLQEEAERDGTSAQGMLTAAE